jgi:multimeric flavodoxin WrbA
VKAVILNGMKPGNGVTEFVHQALVDLLQEMGWEVTPFVLHQMEVAPCAGCFGCWLQTPGKCIMHDTDDVARAYIRSDLVVFLTPLTFGGYSSDLKKVLDHLIGLILPFFQKVQGEIHHQPRYERYPSLLALGTLPRADVESEHIFTALVERNAINMWAPAHVAGVITGDQPTESVRGEIQRLLAELEVV